VTTRDGRALAGVSVRILGNSFGGVWSEAASTLSDAEGFFAFQKIGGEALMLSVSGDDVMPQWFGAHVMREGEEPMELAVSVRCTFQVDLGRESQHANGLRVLDQDDAGLTLFRIGPSGSLSGNSFPIVEGRSESLGVSDSARTLVLLKDGVEVRRVPLLLRPGTLNLITP
jgi:hypothetical protein